MIEGLTIVRKAGGPIGHQALALRFADSDAQVGLARQAEVALAAFGGVDRQDGARGSRRRQDGDRVPAVRRTAGCQVEGPLSASAVRALLRPCR